jgi:hypothetical protein
MFIENVKVRPKLAVKDSRKFIQDSAFDLMSMSGYGFGDYGDFWKKLAHPFKQIGRAFEKTVIRPVAHQVARTPIVGAVTTPIWKATSGAVRFVAKQPLLAAGPLGWGVLGMQRILAPKAPSGGPAVSGASFAQQIASMGGKNIRTNPDGSADWTDASGKLVHTDPTGSSEYQEIAYPTGISPVEGGAPFAPGADVITSPPTTSSILPAVPPGLTTPPAPPVDMTGAVDSSQTLYAPAAEEGDLQGQIQQSGGTIIEVGVDGSVVWQDASGIYITSADGSTKTLSAPLGGGSMFAPGYQSVAADQLSLEASALPLPSTGDWYAMSPDVNAPLGAQQDFTNYLNAIQDNMTQRPMGWSTGPVAANKGFMPSLDYGAPRSTSDNVEGGVLGSDYYPMGSLSYESIADQYRNPVSLDGFGRAVRRSGGSLRRGLRAFPEDKYLGDYPDMSGYGRIVQSKGRYAGQRSHALRRRGLRGFGAHGRGIPSLRGFGQDDGAPFSMIPGQPGYVAPEVTALPPAPNPLANLTSTIQRYIDTGAGAISSVKSLLPRNVQQRMETKVPPAPPKVPEKKIAGIPSTYVWLAVGAVAIGGVSYMIVKAGRK